MSLFLAFDNQTLLACQLLMAAAFFITFAAIRHIYSDLKGVGSIAAGFLLGIPGLFLLFSQGAINPLLSVVVANLLTFASFVLFCRGILTLVDSKRSLLPLWISSAISLLFIYYFCRIHDSIVIRLVVISFNLSLIRILISVEISRHAAGRTVFRLFAGSMFFFALVSASWGLIALFHGVPRDLMQSAHVQTFTLLVTIFSSCLTGLFSLSLCHEQVLTRVRAESEFDALSGTLNRRGIEQKLEIELKRLERTDHPLSIALIDIDYFKTINDTAGHAAGDKAIRDVVNTISAKLRAYDILGRFGGDEFLLVLPQTSSVGANVVAERISDAVRAFSSARTGPSLTVSIGLSQAILGDYSTSLLARADKALYQAKHAGRNCTRTILHDSNPMTTGAPQPLIDILLPPAKPNLLQS
jgi:diguanylate cyclase (GGDEF)-like protein